MYASRKITKGTYTCNGVIENTSHVEYEYAENHSGIVLIAGIGLVLLIIAVIFWIVSNGVTVTL